MTDWQPIETAPKRNGGPAIDLWAKRWDHETDKFEGRRFADFRWNGTRFIGPRRPDGSCETLDNWRPTHWQPLPEPPK
jgi:hypothetical protein